MEEVFEEIIKKGFINLMKITNSKIQENLKQNKHN